MPVNLTAPKPSDLHPVPGVRVGIAMAGVRKANRKDLVTFVLDAGTVVAGVFTQNRFCAAPVQVCREHLASGGADGTDGVRALVINTGNANAGTGADGLAPRAPHVRGRGRPAGPQAEPWCCRSPPA